jgi:hypothetical protein
MNCCVQKIINKLLYYHHEKRSCASHLKQDVDNEDVEDILERVDHTVEHSLQLGHPLDGLQWPQYPEDPQRLDGAQVLSGGASPIGRYHE